MKKNNLNPYLGNQSDQWFNLDEVLEFGDEASGSIHSYKLSLGRALHRLYFVIGAINIE